jgi:hypothetical protein
LTEKSEAIARSKEMLVIQLTRWWDEKRIIGKRRQRRRTVIWGG